MLETVRDSYATVDGGHEAARATELLGELYRSVAEYRENQGDTADADALWQDAVDAFTGLATGFGHVDDEYTGIGNLRLGSTYVDWAHRTRERGDDSTADSLFALAVAPLETTRDSYEWIWDGNGGYHARWGLGQIYASRGSIAVAASDFAAAEIHLADAVTVQTEILDAYEGVVWDDAIGEAYYQRADARVELGLIATDPTVADTYFDDAIADFIVARDSYGHTNGGAMAGDAQNRIDEAETYRDNN
jgi:tetratricopeptide (TPR) repeat protein